VIYLSISQIVNIGITRRKVRLDFIVLGLVGLRLIPGDARNLLISGSSLTREAQMNVGHGSIALIKMAMA
jgi:hypothetical protein